MSIMCEVLLEECWFKWDDSEDFEARATLVYGSTCCKGSTDWRGYIVHRPDKTLIVIKGSEVLHNKKSTFW